MRFMLRPYVSTFETNFDFMSSLQPESHIVIDHNLRGKPENHIVIDHNLRGKPENHIVIDHSLRGIRWLVSAFTCYHACTALVVWKGQIDN